MTHQNYTPIQLCYMDSKVSTTVKPLTATVFRELTRSTFTKDIMKEIESETDEEKKNLLKGKLMPAFFACQMPEDRHRPSEKEGNVRPSGLCLHDFDHMNTDVRQFYEQNLAGKEEEKGIMLAHVTPRGQGLRLVTRMKAGETVMQCQHRMAAELGLTADECVKDLTRLSFIPSQAYMLYVNDQMFSLEAPEEPVLETKVVQKEIPEFPEVAPNMAQILDFQGVKYSDIIQELLQRLATGGSPREGERNSDLYALVRELRHCTQYNFELTRQLVVPYFSDLSDQEIRKTINSAINTTGRTMTPTMQGILSQLKSEQTTVEDSHETEYPKLPKLPKVIGDILKLYPKHIHKQVLLSCLPILGIYGTHVRFRYLNNRPNSLSFMTAVVGKSGRGKAFVKHEYDLLTGTLKEWDKQEREKANAYQRKMTHRKEGEEFPEDPRPKIRLFSDDMTTSIMLEYLDNLEGEHALQFTEEVIRLVKARKSRFSDNDDLYCKAYDNAQGGKESKSLQTRNIQIDIFLNCLFAGTFHAMHELYNNPEGGLNNRMIYAILPSQRTRGIPRYEDPSPELQKAIDDMTMKLWVAGTLEEEEGMEITDYKKVRQGKREFSFPFLDKVISKWIDKCDDEDDENPDDTWRDLANRAACTGYRAGVLAWFLWGRPTDKKTLKYVQDFALWVAESARVGVYNFCGNEYDALNEQSHLQPKVRQTKNKKLFSVLGQEFTVSDVINIRLQNGDSTHVDMIISRWVADGLIQRVGNKRFVKTKQIA